MLTIKILKRLISFVIIVRLKGKHFNGLSSPLKTLT